MKKGFTSKILGLLVVTMLMGSVAMAAATTVTTYAKYSSSVKSYCKTVSSGYSSYVTSWAECSDDNSSDYDSNRGYQSSSAKATIYWNDGDFNYDGGAIY